MKKTFRPVLVGGILFVVSLILISCGKYDHANDKFPKGLEIKILKELRSELNQNLNDINSNIEYLKISVKANKTIIDHMENGTPYNDSLDYHFSNLYPYLIFAPNQTTFDYLKQSGLLLISNDSTRAAISDIYGVQYSIYSSYESIYFVEHYTNYIKPMFMKEFKTFEFYNSFKPKNYDQFINNQEYKQVMRYTIDACRSFIYMQSSIKDNVEKLISDIDKKLVPEK